MQLETVSQDCTVLISKKGKGDDPQKAEKDQSKGGRPVP